MPCGYTKDQATREWQGAILRPEWKALPAVEAGRVHVVDAQSYFSRPGPRLIEGVSQLASFLHPDIPSWGSSVHEDETSSSFRPTS
jgi:iron complex transport system substrate-binding protein